jgi:hypothetical protein
VKAKARRVVVGVHCEELTSTTEALTGLSMSPNHRSIAAAVYVSAPVIGSTIGQGGMMLEAPNTASHSDRAGESSCPVQPTSAEGREGGNNRALVSVSTGGARENATRRAPPVAIRFIGTDERVINKNGHLF